MTFSSVYEMFNPLTTVAKQHSWNWLSGDQISNEFLEQNVAGTGSGAMNDTVDGGFRVTSGATTNNETQYGWNNKRTVDFTDFRFTGVMSAVSVTSQISYIGVQTGMGLTHSNGSTSKSLIMMDTGNTNFAIKTCLNGAISETEGSTAIDTAWHVYRIEGSSSSNIMKLDGTTEVTKTTNLPTQKMNSLFGVQTLTSSAKSTDVRYTEVMNI